MGNESPRAAIADSITAWAARIGEGLDDLDEEGRREIVRLVLEGVHIDEDGYVRMEVVLAPSPIACRRAVLHKLR